MEATCFAQEHEKNTGGGREVAAPPITGPEVWKDRIVGLFQDTLVCSPSKEYLRDSNPTFSQ